MKIGILGLGNIAQKAYLPIYSQARHLANFVLATRNANMRNKIVKKYGFQESVASIEELIQTGIEACFVHTATQVHGETVRQLLEAGIHVFVDKPLSETIEEVAELQQLAQNKNVQLMVGFNRRFAPYTQVLKNIPNKQTIIIKKNRVSTLRETKFMIYDLFLHVVDTAVYLTDDPIISSHSKLIAEKGLLKRAVLSLETAQTSILCTMDLQSGANTESFEVTSPVGTYCLDNLSKLSIQTDQMFEVREMDDWATTLEKRGFQQMVMAFIQGIEVSDQSLLKQEDVYLSHALCDKMLNK